MRQRFTVADLRMKLAVRLAVAPRQLFKTLWSPQSRPHETDAAREALLAHITQGWDGLEIDALGPEIVHHSVPPTSVRGRTQ